MNAIHPLQVEFYKLLESKQDLFDRFQESIFDGVWYWNLEQPEQRWMSPNFWEVLGYDANEKNNGIKDWLEVIHPEDRHLTNACMDKQKSDPAHSFDQVMRYLHKDKSTVYIRCRGFSICNEQGRPTRLLGINTNLTDYVDLQNSLTTENLSITQRLKYALEGSQDGVWDWNLETHAVFYSPRWKEILGYKDAEIENTFASWERLLHPEDLITSKHYVQAYIESDAISFETRFRMRHKAGHFVPILSRAKKVTVPVTDSTEPTPHLIGTHVDLTEIVAIEDRLNQQIKLTETYLNSTSAIMLALDTDANITMLNQKGLDVLGVTKESIIGKPWFKQDFFPTELGVRYQRLHAAFMNRSMDLSQVLDHPLITQNGELRIFTWSNTLLKNDTGEVIGSLSSGIDITKRTEIQQKLQQSESLLKQAQQLAKLGYYTLDLKLDQWSSSETLDEMFGIDRHYQRTTIGWTEIIHPNQRQMMHDYFINEVVQQKKQFNKTYQIINQTTLETLWVHGKGDLTYDESGRIIKMFGTIQDISQQKKAEAQLTLAASVYQNANEGIMVTDIDNLIVDVNQAFTDITGYSKAEVLGKTPKILHSGHHNAEFYNVMWSAIHKTGKWEGEVWNRKKSGELYPQFISISTIKDQQNNVQHYLALSSDISIQKNHEDKLQKMAHFDALTDLPNRVLFRDRLDQSIVRCNRNNDFLSLAFLDLDGFKEINDTYGHDIGDQLLKIISTRYRQQARESDTVARIGGDEFIILLNETNNIEETLNIYERFLESTRQPIFINGHQLTVSCSIGITYYPQANVIDSDQLIRQADHAMYQAKLLGKNGYHIFDDEKDQVARALHQKISAIEHAINHEEFVLYYQPKINMLSGEVLGLEALIRWQHPKKGLLLPADFLPAVEKNSLSISLDKWVIEAAFKQASIWTKQNILQSISVNLGEQILQNYKLIEFLESMFAQYPNVVAQQIQVEVLETCALEDMEHASNLMRRCQELGVKVAIDDFGTGYSSLGYIKNLPATYLKIDQSFVRDMLVDEGDLAILKAVIGLAEAFGMQTIAEGVETHEHCRQLVTLGSHIGQGYGIARPMPADAVQKWLHDR